MASILEHQIYSLKKAPTKGALNLVFKYYGSNDLNQPFIFPVTSPIEENLPKVTLFFPATLAPHIHKPTTLQLSHQKHFSNVF